jgi:hypothetical protein
MHTWIFGVGLVRDDDIVYTRRVSAARRARQERAFDVIFWRLAPNLACLSGKMPHPRLQRLAIVLFFAACLGFDYQVTIEPTIDPGSVGRDVSTVAGGFNRPGGSPGCYENGRIYMSDTGNHVIKSVDRGSGDVNTEAGKQGVNGFVDGRGEEAAFYNPQGVAVGPDDTGACPPRAARGRHPPANAHAPRCIAHRRHDQACTDRAQTTHVYQPTLPRAAAVYIADMMNHAIRRIVVRSTCPDPQQLTRPPTAPSSPSACSGRPHWAQRSALAAWTPLPLGRPRGAAAALRGLPNVAKFRC